MEELSDNISKDEIEEQGKVIANIHCEDCSYDTGLMDMKSAVFTVNMQGGYFMYDGEGGAICMCPSCGNNGLLLTD